MAISDCPLPRLASRGHPHSLARLATDTPPPRTLLRPPPPSPTRSRMPPIPNLTAANPLPQPRSKTPPFPQPHVALGGGGPCVVRVGGGGVSAANQAREGLSKMGVTARRLDLDCLYNQMA